MHLHFFRLTRLRFKPRGSTPVLSPSVYGFNHLREQRAYTFINQILKEMDACFVVHIKPELFLELSAFRRKIRTKQEPIYKKNGGFGLVRVKETYFENALFRV